LITYTHSYVQNGEFQVLNTVVCTLTTRLMYRSNHTHMTSQVLSNTRKGINRNKTSTWFLNMGITAVALF